MNLPSFIVVALLFVSCVESIFAQEDLQRLIEQLSQPHADDVRIAAADKLLEIDGDKPLVGYEALKQGLTDPNPKVRQKFGVVLGLLLAREKNSCPIELVDLLFDQDRGVRYNLVLVLSGFDAFDDGSFSRILRFYDNADIENKRDGLSLLAAAGGSDPRVLKRLTEALENEDVEARNQATYAMWKATKDLEVVVPLLIRQINDSVEFRAKDKPGTDENGQAIHVALGALSACVTFHVHLSEREDEFLKVVRKRSEDASAGQRHGLTKWILESIKLKASSEKNKKDDNEETWKIPHNDLTKLRPILQSMSDDEEQTVRQHASEALKILKKIVPDKQGR